jgi:predicted transcriptional regulator
MFIDESEKPAKRRAKSEIYCDILAVISQGTTRPTKIQQRANLTWSNLLTDLDALTRDEFITREVRYGVTSYHLTPKGKSAVELSTGLRELLGNLDSYYVNNGALEVQNRPISAANRWDDRHSDGSNHKNGAIDTFSLSGKSVLLEVDPSLSYEHAVSKIVTDFKSKGHAIHLFSWKGSPVYDKLSGWDGVNLRTMDPGVSSRKKGEKKAEILIPQDNHVVLLDELSKVIQSSTTDGVLLIFDSISDLMISENLETAYKVLKTVNGLASGTRTTMISILRCHAHDERAESLIKGIYAYHLLHDFSGLRLAREA